MWCWMRRTNVRGKNFLLRKANICHQTRYLQLLSFLAQTMCGAGVWYVGWKVGNFWRPLRFSPQINGRIITVCCKLHNLCLQNNEQPSNFYEISPRDINWQRGDTCTPDSTVLFTDGITVRSGSRTDLHKSTVRDRLTERLARLGLRRPSHSTFKKTVRRIRDML